jgi:hypothetical protein
MRGRRKWEKFRMKDLLSTCIILSFTCSFALDSNRSFPILRDLWGIRTLGGREGGRIKRLGLASQRSVAVTIAHQIPTLIH